MCVTNACQSVSDHNRTDGLNWFSAIGPDLSGLPLWSEHAETKVGTLVGPWRPPKIGSLEKLFKIYLLAAQRIRKLEFRPGKPGFDARGNCRGWNYVGAANSELLQCTCFREEMPFFCLFWSV